MKKTLRKTLSLFLAFSLLCSLGLTAAASEALGEDLTSKDTLLNRETQLSTNVFWSTAYSDLRTENVITYSPNDDVTPIVTYGGTLTSRTTVTSAARALEGQGYRVVAGINGDFFNTSNGLPIGAQTPAEIAVSIAAELVQERARRGPAAAPPAAGEPGVLCTITAKRGSAPRGVGTWMLVRPDGSVLGTIGGGAVEHLAVQEAKALWAHGGGPVRRHYDLTPGAAELGMVCGGDIDVEFEVRK